jgi:tetratricopeptide (TPR) repeat protein
MNGAGADGRKEKMQQALDEGAEQLRQLKLSRSARSLTTLALKVFKQREPADILNAIEGLRRDIAEIDKVLKEIHQRGVQAEQAEAIAEPFGDAWMSNLKRRLDRSASENKPGAWFIEWLDSWSDALAASQWACCTAIAALTEAGAARQVTQAQLARIATHLQLGQPSRALSALAEILGGQEIPAKTATRLGVLRSRILRRVLDDVAGAVKCAAETVQLSEDVDEPIRVLAHVALAEAYQDDKRFADARALLDESFVSEAVIPDLFVAAGRLATAEGSFSWANQFYDAAAVRFGAEMAEPHLLREVPGNLLWRTGRHVAKTDKEAGLQLISKALDVGIQGDSAYPDRRALREKARLLEDLGRDAEAAATYRDAAERYSSASDRALQLYEKAYTLAPQDARYHWTYGEALRSRTVDPDGVVDVNALKEAKALLDNGFALAAPGRDDAWALVSTALAADKLGDDPDPAILIERAILLNPDYERGYAFLATLLRERGFVMEAATAARHGYVAAGRGKGNVVASGDRLATQLHALTLADLGHYREALKILDHYLALHPVAPDLILTKTSMHMRLEEYDAALRALDRIDLDEETADFIRGVCYSAAGREDDERRCFEAVWEGRENSNRNSYVGWAAYRVGLLDEAVRVLSELIERGSTVWSNRFALAQVRLVRGNQDEDDIGIGAELLLTAIDGATLVDDLVQMATVELPLARKAVRGQRHERRVQDILDEAGRHADERCAQLRSMVRPVHQLAARLAQGRTAVADERFDEALPIYVDLARAADPPEARSGLRAAARGLLHEGDLRLAHGDLAAAGTFWDKLTTATRLLSPGDPFTRMLQARFGLRLLELNGPADNEAIRLLQDCDEPSLSEALQHFARDVPTLWLHRDGLRAIAAHAGLRASQVATLTACSQNVPFETVYSLGRRAVSDQAVFPFVGAVELALGSNHVNLIGSVGLSEGIRALRERFAAEAGVRIPGVRVYGDERLSPDTAQFLTYEQVVGDVAVPAGETSPADVILWRFDRVLRDNLFRLVAVDEVDLWAAGWEVLTGPAAGLAWGPPDAPARLRLARLLRMLLRESIPINDRHKILDAFRSVEERLTTGPLETLAEVRSCLYPAILGPDPSARIWPLPSDLEARMAAGLAPDGPVWELPRDSAAELVRDLRRWRTRELPPEPVTLSVREARIRPFLWRLLAADRPVIYVVAEEELP